MPLPISWRTISIATLALVGTGEGIARFGLGLGDPPLIVRDATIDYLFRPGMTYQRFGNRIAYNSVSMRAREPRRPPSACELRVLVLGDSIINGGSETDQKALATTIAETILASELKRDIWIGNISAGGWGPANLKAYIEKYGWFDAHAVVLVVNTLDIVQTMEFMPDLGPQFPTHKPASALVEGMTRYLPRYLPFAIQAEQEDEQAAPGVPADTPPGTPNARQPEEALIWLISQARSHDVTPLVIHHKMKDETPGLPNGDWRVAAGAKLRAVVGDAGADYLDFGTITHQGRKRGRIYRDYIHLTIEGQALLAEAMLTWLRPRLAGIAASLPATCPAATSAAQ
jgi:hypothetical protein